MGTLLLMDTESQIKKLLAFQKGLNNHSTIYLNTELANLLKDYPEWSSEGFGNILAYRHQKNFDIAHSSDYVNTSFGCKHEDSSTAYWRHQIEKLKETYNILFNFESKEQLVYSSYLSLNSYGEWQGFGDTKVRYSDGIQVFVGLETQAQLYRVKKAWQKEMQYPNPDHDYCSYCGTDNGLYGEYRVGFDCCYCGGN